MKNELISHPDKLLITHLSEVANIAVKTIKGKSFNFSLNFNDDEVNITSIIPDLMYLAAAFHDLGKATSFFQAYIRNPEEEHDKRKSHALISALFVYFITEKYLKKLDINPTLKQLLSVFVFSSVKSHHGRLKNLSGEILIEPEWRELLTVQVKSIDTEKIKNIIDVQLSDFDFVVDWSDFIGFIENEEYNLIFDDFSCDILDTDDKELTSNTQISLFCLHQ